jgi:mono/diheme cytochrome c family protein
MSRRGRGGLAGWAATLAAAGALALAACGQAPPTGDGSTVADGAELYAANCAVCHGAEGEGTTQGPPLVHIVYEPGHHSDEAFHRAAAAGVIPHHWDFGPMPPLPHLDRDQMDAIIAYVRGLQRDAGIQ